jgi:N-acetylglucosaminyl-diphospho-decaprenol L-rhamnosyltransferase
MTTAMTETITLSIISHGHDAMLHALLDDIAAFEHAEKYHVIVTLNLVTEVLDLRRWPRLRIQLMRNTKPKGFGANHNQAFAQCTTSWFVVLNPDLRMPMDPLPELTAHARAVENVGAVTPSVVSVTGQEEDHVRCNLTPWALWRRYRGHRMERMDLSHPADLSHGFYWLAGMFIAFPTDAFRQVDGFDERFFLYCEDYDICARLVLDRHTLLKVPTVRVIHAAQRDSHRSLRHLRWHLQSLAKVWTSGAYWRLLASTRR